MTDSPASAGGSLEDYRAWLTSISGIGPVLADRILAAFPDYFELARSNSGEIADRVKGLSESAAKAILENIAQAEARESSAATPPSTPTEPTPSVSESVDHGPLFAGAAPQVVPPDPELTTVSAVEQDAEQTEAEPAEEGGFFSRPLDFKPVSEPRKQPPVSIDALKKQHEARQSAAGLRPDGGTAYSTKSQDGKFATYRKPKADTHLVYQDESNDTPEPKRPAGNARRSSLWLPLLLILIGLGLVGYSVFTLWNGNSTDSSSQSGDLTPTKDPLVKFLTFDFSPDEDEPLTEEDEPPAETPDETTEPADTETTTEEPTSEETTEPEPEPTPEPEPEPAVLPADTSVSVLNGNGRSGAAGLASQILRDDDFNVASVGNANRFDYQTTTIFFAPDNQAKAELVQASLADTYTLEMTANAYAGQSTDVVVVVGNQ